MTEDRRLYTKEAMEKFEKEMSDFPNYNKVDFDQLFPGIRERDEKIASLITTIESQKEEIERHKKDSNYWNNEHSKETERADKLKVVNDLAVKGLKEIACLNVDSAYSAGTIARNTFSEIARLQNE